MKHNIGTKKLQSEGGATISQHLIEISQNTWCDCFLRGDRKLMKEVKLSPSYVHHFCLCLINSGAFDENYGRLRCGKNWRVACKFDISSI